MAELRQLELEEVAVGLEGEEAGREDCSRHASTIAIVTNRSKILSVTLAIIGGMMWDRLVARTRDTVPGMKDVGIIISGVLLIAALAGVGGLARHELEDVRIHVELVGRKIDSLASDIRARPAVRFVDLQLVAHHCFTSNDTMVCDLTNDTDGTITTCMQGHLTKRKGAGELLTLPVCTGPIQPLSSVRMNSQWESFAKSLCKSRDGWGREYLDFDECRFTIDPWNPADTDANTVPRIASGPISTTISERDKSRIHASSDD